MYSCFYWRTNWMDKKTLQTRPL